MFTLTQPKKHVNKTKLTHILTPNTRVTRKPAVRVDKKDGRSSRGSFYRPTSRVEERMEELDEVEEEEEEEEEIHEVPQDYDVEEDPDNIVIRPPPSDDEDM